MKTKTEQIQIVKDFVSDRHDVDVKWFYKINHFTYRSSTLDSFMSAVTQLGEGWLPMMLVAMVYTNFYNDTEWLRHVLYSFAISGLITQALKKAVNRSRPPAILPDAIIVGPKLMTNSFPSGHTTSAFAVAVMCALYWPFLAIELIALAVLAGISRIYLGAHFPLDVAIGATIGIITAIVTKILL